MDDHGNRDAHASRGARRCPRRSRGGGGGRVRSAVSGVHHPLCLGRAVVATRSRPAHAQRDHARRACRRAGRERARHARPRRAAQRADPGRDPRGVAAHRRSTPASRRPTRPSRSPSACSKRQATIRPRVRAAGCVERAPAPQQRAHLRRRRSGARTESPARGASASGAAGRPARAPRCPRRRSPGAGSRPD